MSDAIYKKSQRSFLNKDRSDLSSISWGVTLNENYLDATLDLNDGDKALYFSGFMSIIDDDYDELVEFKGKMMNLRDNIDDLIEALEKGEKKMRKIRGEKDA